MRSFVILAVLLLAFAFINISTAYDNLPEDIRNLAKSDPGNATNDCYFKDVGRSIEIATSGQSTLYFTPSVDRITWNEKLVVKPLNGYPKTINTSDLVEINGKLYLPSSLPTPQTNTNIPSIITELNSDGHLINLSGPGEKHDPIGHTYIHHAADKIGNVESSVVVLEGNKVSADQSIEPNNVQATSQNTAQAINYQGVTTICMNGDCEAKKSPGMEIVPFLGIGSLILLLRKRS